MYVVSPWSLRISAIHLDGANWAWNVERLARRIRDLSERLDRMQEWQEHRPTVGLVDGAAFLVGLPGAVRKYE
jgi:hypothetical protein